MNPKVRVAVSFLDDNLHREIYAAEVARVVRLSRSRLYHLFKSELGIPITTMTLTLRDKCDVSNCFAVGVKYAVLFENVL